MKTVIYMPHSSFCAEKGLDFKSMARVVDIRNQLEGHLRRLGVPLKAADNDTESVRKAIVAGFFAHAARYERTDGRGNVYSTIRGHQRIRIHPSSVLSHHDPKLIVFCQVCALAFRLFSIACFSFFSFI